MLQVKIILFILLQTSFCSSITLVNSYFFTFSAAKVIRILIKNIHTLSTFGSYIFYLNRIIIKLNIYILLQIIIYCLCRLLQSLLFRCLHLHWRRIVTFQVIFIINRHYRLAHRLTGSIFLIQCF